jgi:hypothetical protein
MNRVALLVLSLCLIGQLSSNAQAAQLIAEGAAWSYLDDGSDQGTAWQAIAFDDSSWAIGNAQLGYGDGDETTVVSFGPNANDVYPTTYFRHEFQVPNPAAVPYLAMRLLDDDGSVVYLNGIEVVRNNMPAGVIDYLTLARGAVSSTENNFEFWVLDPNDLVTGTNVLAIEVHQSDVDSNDLSLDVELSDALPEPLQRGPYLQKATSTSMVIRWRTPFNEDSRVQFGAAPGALNTTVDDLVAVKDHEVLVSGLTPGTVYYYSVGSTSVRLAGDDPDHWFKTSPVPGSATPTRFWLLGDCGTANGGQRAVRNAFEFFNGGTSTDLVLLLGDNAYLEGTDPQYQNAVFDMYAATMRTTPLFSTRGNHEKYASVYYDMFSFPTAAEAGGLASGTEAYYSLDFGNVHLICLDSNSSDLSPTGVMATWLAADLAATAQPWIVVFFHHPPYTDGSHTSDDPNDSGGRLIAVRENILPILEDGGVDMVFSGHSHAYERSYLIDGHYGLSSTFTAAHQIDSGDGSPAGDGAYVKGFGAHAGTVYTVAGSSGKTSSSGQLSHPAMVVSHRTLGSVVLDANDDRLDLTFLNVYGQALDSYTLTTTDQSPVLSTTPLIGGQYSFLTVSQITPGNAVYIAYSLTGGGPTSSIYGDILLDSGFAHLAHGTGDIFGLYTVTDLVPTQLSGTSVWFQALELTGGGNGLLSNGLMEQVQ